MQSKNGLNIIIVGCGKVGMTLIEQLSKEGHDITIIDKNAAKVQEMSNLYDIMGLVGNGASYSVQMEAGIENADLIIAVTASDELNLLCCTVAKQVGDCAAIARVRTPDYSKEAGYLREKLGLTMIINPELEASLETARILYLPTALEVNSFAHGQAEIVKFKIPDGNLLDGMTIATLGKSITNDILICAIEREGEVYIPGGNFQMAKDDIVSFVAPRRHIRSFLKKIGFKTKQVKDAMIVGGGKASYYLAKQLIAMGIDVKIIEQNKKNTVRHVYFGEYLALQKLCLLILQHRKHQVGSWSKQIYGILFDGAWLWEEYINSLIEDIFYHPMNKAHKGAQWLFDGNVGLIYPDFISRNSKTRMIADAKYKPIDNIGNRDYLQALAYMFRFDAKTGYYFYPEVGNHDALRLCMNRGSTYESNVSPRDNISIIKHGLKIPVDAPDYAVFVTRMANAEQDFMKVFSM